MKKSIRTEIFILIICSVTIPLIIVSAVTYKVSLQAVEKEYQSNSAIILNNLSLNFDQYLQGIENGTLLAYMDGKLLKSLQNRSEFRNNYDKIENQKVIQDFVQGIELMIKNVNGVQIFSGDRVFYAGSYDLVGADYDYNYQNTAWYEKTIKAAGQKVLFGTHKPFQRRFSNDSVISMARAIRSLDNHQILGVILLDIRLDKLKEIFSLTEHDKRNFIMMDEMGRLIYSSKYHQDTSAIKLDRASLEKILHNSTGSLYTEIDDEKVYLNYVTSKYSGWKVIQYIDVADITKDSAVVGRIILVVAAASAIFATLVMFFISNRVSKPIIQLSRRIQLVGEGFFSGDLESSRRDEIGTLIRGFNRMVTDLKHYIERVATAKAKQNEAQFIALQSQINPHFLANTLESIQMKAVLNDQREIGEMIGALGHLFRIHIRTDRELVPLKSELEYIRLYFRLQKMRYEDRIDYVEQVEEGCEQLQVVRFMLQPIVENSLKYGLDNLMVKGVVTIKAYLSKDALFIEVTDNGAGMDSDRLRELQARLEVKEDGQTLGGQNIGIQNVHDRIRLHFGAEYGLHIESAPTKGTTVTIRLPIVS
ncbi:sensor histidine kinase [Neobacillus mesonae]|uniref:cache domain-containing sensor histidine kinase n=1 Tax=Neobacillus mesonae TaxID=1193713 RepID=UPI002E205E8A|nr:sensor histidine kinase [Neobacillus mesonae]